MTFAKSFLLTLLSVSLAVPALAQTGTVVFSNIPSPQPPNLPSRGYQCCQTLELGDWIQLEAETPRTAGFATVLMSSWALHSAYPSLAATGYRHPITLAIYRNAAEVAAHTPWKQVTQEFTIPWRPEADPTCPGGTAWRAANGTCYNGFAFPIVFDLRPLGITLPDEFIYGVAYNTNSWGYEPIGLPGPYESLNVGLVTDAPTVGTDEAGVVFWNTLNAGYYSDGGAGGVGVFRATNFVYTAAVEFTTFAVPTTTAECKNGAWENLVRADFTSFRNQGACVSYVNTGR